MKIIHTADIHLDSPLVGVKDGKARRAELLRALSHLSAYANNNGAAAIIVAGDLFDDKYVSSKTVESVAQIIESSCAQWFVLRGNHGDETPYAILQKLCSNVSFFGDEWTTYALQNVAITGRELGTNDQEYWGKLQLNDNMFNILVLHGDIDSDAYGIIDKKAIALQPINYVALGHRHTFAEHKFGNVRGCYSGVLEPRGFDETGTTGFVVIDTETGKVCFQKQYLRCVESVRVDVSNISTDLQLEQAIFDAVAHVSPNNYLNLEFFGTLCDGVRPEEVAATLKDRFYALRVKNDTQLGANLSELRREVSLRGEFVKLAMEIEDEQLRNQVLRLGLAALEGEV